jgi:hypothetical protein
MYAGRAVTRAVVLKSTKEEDLNDFIDDLEPEETLEMEKRISFFTGKFATIGRLRGHENAIDL